MENTLQKLRATLFSNPVIYVPVVIISAIFIILVIISFERGKDGAQGNQTGVNQSTSDVSFGDTSIYSVNTRAKNLDDLGIGKNNIKKIQNAIIELAQQHDSTITSNNAKISVRDGSIRTRTYTDEADKEFYYLNLIVDLPNNEQSYQVVHEWGESTVVEDSAFEAMVFCLRDDDKKNYKNFNCKDSYQEDPKYSVVSHFLAFEQFDNFVISTADASDKKIYIQQPSNSERAKWETKEWIKVMGFTDSGFEIEIEEETAAPPDEK